MIRSYSRGNLFNNFRDWFFYKKTGHVPDYTFLLLLVVILILGLVFLSSASSVISYDEYKDAYFLFKQQLYKGIILGLFVFFVTSHIPFDFWRKNALLILISGLVLVLLIFVPGIGIEYLGGRRWLNLPGFSFQPSEFLKLALIIYLAAWFETKQPEIKNLQATFLPFVGILALVATLVLLQPDMGTTFLLVAICVSMYYLAGGSIFYISGLGIIGSIIFWFLVKQAPYRLDRLTIFLNPEIDPQGIGYHINQAFLAIGSGGLLGRGLGHSRQKFNYLPEVANDSIFAVIAEELGFILTFFFLSLYFYFFYRGMSIAKKAPDLFSKLLVSGIMVWIIWQVLVNIMAMVGLVPLTGTPLPFVSYGSSSLVVLLAGLGIIFNVSRFTK
ncbi:MAG: putative lipid II flippase FtsW [Candidatus Margulisiibacteriota bacterium]|jgi:cell division protein FtsW